MTTSFSGNQLIDIAIGIEKNGLAFYDVMAISTEDNETKAAFHYLAEMERAHIGIFQAMLTEADKYSTSETYSGESAKYIQSLVDNTVFTDEMATGELTTQVNTDIGALELAINAEKDSILLYYEMKEIIAKQAQPSLNKIISEEKSHLEKLSELKKRLATA